MIAEIARIFRDEDRFVLATHINPDGDALGSLLGTTLALKEMGKQAVPLCADAVPSMYDFLPGREFVIADPSDAPFEPEWIVVLDTATRPRVSGDITKFGNGTRLINVDHHGSNPRYGDINLILGDATSTAEIVHAILALTDYDLSPDVAQCLYTGLITDTGCFRFSGVTSKTLQVGAEMLATGFDAYDLNRRLFEENPFERIMLERIMLERMELLLDGRLTVSTLLARDFTETGAKRSDMENLVDRLREIRGVEVGVLITENENGPTRVSFRSKGLVDVSAIASLFGGGGHRAAAGLRTDMSPGQAREEIIAAVAKALNGSLHNRRG